MSGKQHVAQWHPEAGRFLSPNQSCQDYEKPGHFAKSKLVAMHLGKVTFSQPMVISAPSDLKIGEEVLVIRNGDLIGSARCKAAGWEWNGGIGRLAKSQHRL